MRRMLPIVFLLAVLAAWPAGAADKVELAPGTHDLRDLTLLVSQATGRTVLYGPEFSGQITLEASESVSDPDEIWRIYLSALATKDWAVVMHGGVVRIVKREQMPGESSPVIMVGEDPATIDEGHVTATFELNNADPTEVAMQLSPLVGKGGQVIPLPNQGRLVVVASAANVEKIRKMLDKIDVEERRRHIEIVRLKHANPTDTRDLITHIFATHGMVEGKMQRRETAGGLIVVPEPRSQSLVLRGQEADVAAAVKLIQAIDGAADPIILIRDLRFAQPDKLGATLNNILNP
jgi:general secretion pathway protein D